MAGPCGDLATQEDPGMAFLSHWNGRVGTEQNWDPGDRVGSEMGEGIKERQDWDI